MKVYVVTAGSYSDYHIKKCFVHRNDAESYARKDSEVEECDVEEHDLNPVDDFVERERWIGFIRLGDGKVTSLSKARSTALARKGARGETMIEPADQEGYASAHSYVSKEHAEKLLVEARQKWLREKAIA